ncbi:MAG: pyridoxal phosphate-dependent aminotransferase [Proteobacteria bacterium]|nr:pyridoxal phosphate-dependent aminotransferase [Pseudomonadota bacterium]
MNFAADRLSSVASSASEGASQKARELVARGVDVISLASGEPDFETPGHVVDAADAAMRAGQTRYTGPGGTPELKKAVIAKFKRDNGLSYELPEVIASAGAKNMVFLGLMATVNPGDEVIVPAPYWVSYTEMTKLVGGTPVVIKGPENNGFKIDADLLESAITPRTRWLLLNSPSNPIGTIYSREELEALAAVVRRHPRLLVMTDEIYEHIVFDGLRAPSFAAVAPDLKDRTLTINGVSKSYAMTGWRIGFAGGHADLIKAMGKVQSQTVGAISSISQAGAVAALSGPQDFLEKRSSLFQQRRDKVLTRLAHVPLIRCHRPSGAFYLFVECKGMIGKKTPKGATLETDKDVADFLLDDALVVVVPGAAYGISPYFRMSIATSMERLDAACDRMIRAIESLR